VRFDLRVSVIAQLRGTAGAAMRDQSAGLLGELSSSAVAREVALEATLARPEVVGRLGGWVGATAVVCGFLG
jgi:hypothetical protein